MDVIDKRFRVLKKVYTNEIADTYLVEDLEQDNRVVELKILIKTEYMDNTFFHLFKSEVSVLKKLEHPLIPKYLYSNEVQDEDSGMHYFYIVYDYIKTRTLEEILQDKNEETRKKVQEQFFPIAKKILEVLHYLSEVQVVHRSISTATICLDENFTPYLTHFGSIRNKSQSARRIEPIIGDFERMPNEQKLGFANPRSDQYALGIVFLSILHQLPSYGVKNRAALDLVMESLVLEDGLKAFIETMLQPDSTERFKNTEVMLKLWEQLEAGEAINIKEAVEAERQLLGEEYLAKEILKNENLMFQMEKKQEQRKEFPFLKVGLYFFMMYMFAYLFFKFFGVLAQLVDH